VVTDVTGLVLLLPWTRRWVADVIRRRLEQRLGVQGVVGDPSMFVGMGDAFGTGDVASPRGAVIDVDAVETPPHEPRA
jgi:UPF0716 family protein affecting phage T7 exclusion